MRWQRYIGIDYSGAETSTARLPGLAACMAVAGGDVTVCRSPEGRWSRRTLAAWLARTLDDGVPTIVGIDHGFSAPEAWFDHHGIERRWAVFLDDFCRWWPTDADGVRVQDILDAAARGEPGRFGLASWKRMTERASAAKSIFQFHVQGSVAKSTHAGLPWLRGLRLRWGDTVHWWPFDGWTAPAGRSAVAEAYPSVLRWRYADETVDLDDHHADAYAIAAWLRDRDADGRIDDFLRPPLSADDEIRAGYEGWILGVM